jgi:hypothetical protein
MAGLMMVVGMSLMAASATAAEEEGFKSLFDGKTLNGWEGDPTLWRVEEGAITGETKADKPIKYNSFIIWRQGEVDDFELKLQYRIPSGNSGIQYRSFVNDKVGPFSVGGYQADFEAGDQWSGCNYGEQFRGILAKRGEMTVIGEDRKPHQVAMFGNPDKLGALVKKNDWNEYHIIARGYTLIHKVNGRVMSIVTDEDKENRRRSGILALQLHAGPPMKMQVRNIRLKRLPMKDKKKIVFVAGAKSHGYMGHEHKAGNLLLAKLLNENVPEIHATTYAYDWPTDPTAFDNADAIVMYSNGGANHMVVPHLDEVGALAKKGVNIACVHYGVEVEKGKPGDAFIDWIGGYFETFWSVNPWWTAEFTSLPDHPVARGVKPFAIEDEWYYNMRFRHSMEGITPILTAVPPLSTIEREDGPHSNNKHVRMMTKNKTPQHLLWVFERPDGGRGFGFTGGHWHYNWANDQFRKVILNALVWLVGVDVPKNGVPSKTPTLEELEANQDYEKPKDFNRDKITKLIKEWND